MKASWTLRTPLMFFAALLLTQCGSDEDQGAKGMWRPPYEQPCQSPWECKEPGQTCVSDDQEHRCGTPRSCADVAPVAQGAYCEAERPGSQCLVMADGGGFACQIPPPATERRYIRVLDTSPVCAPEPRADRVDEAGTDLSLVSLLRGKEAVAWAKVAWSGAYAPALEAQLHKDVALVFDGNAKPTNERECASEPHRWLPDQEWVSLGCGGSIVLSFERDGQPVVIETGMTLRLTDQGPYCTLKHPADDVGDDRYRVEVCQTKLGEQVASIDFDAACTAVGGEQESGITLIDVVD